MILLSNIINPNGHNHLELSMKMTRKLGTKALLLYFTAQLLIHVPIQRAFALSSNINRMPTSWGGWRVALDIGREPFTTMPQSWAATGARFPLVMKCNFTDDGEVGSITGDVKYTIAVVGEVTKPVQAGLWSLRNDRDLSFTLKFPEKMERNGVELGPCEIICEGLLYTKKDLKKMDQNFYEVRSITDDINAQVKEAKQRKEAPKKWNFETNQWEKRYRDESFVSTFGKRLKQFRAGIVEETESKKRPTPLELSIEAGDFPGIDSVAYMKKRGVIKMKGGGMDDGVIGTWSAEPINDNPASYYRPTF